MAERRLYKIFSPIRDFINDSRFTGILLITCTAVSIALSNFSFSSHAYTRFWLTAFAADSSNHWWHLPESVLLLINDVLMTFFFFLVGMEIKRELTIGELASIRKSLLPVLAALGGMLCPAAIYAFFNIHTPSHSGWGIPMATDIAFSLGVLSLLGKRIPVQLKIFLAALAIIDDLGAVITIAIFYTSHLNFWYLGAAVCIAALLILFNRTKKKSIAWYLLPGILLWYCLFNSGIHATIASVVVSFCMPLQNLARMEHILHKPVNFLIMPLFALANTAIALPGSIGDVFSSPVSPGVILGLVIGKPLGIFFFSFIAIRLGIASLPSNTNYTQLWGISLLGGIGFTMSIFTTGLAFVSDGQQVIAKVSVMIGSLISGVIGYYYLHLYRHEKDLQSVHPPKIRKPFQFTPGVQAS